MSNIKETTPTSFEYITAVEAAIGTPLFYDEQRESAARGAPWQLSEEDFATRGMIYATVLRDIAALRRAERQLAQEAPDYDARAWNNAWEFNAERQQSLHADAETFYKMLSLGRHMLMTNNIQRAASGEGASEASKKLREDQKEVRAAIEKFHLTPSKPPPGEGWRALINRFGVVVAPTGAGKTAMMGVALNELGIGQPSTALDNGPLRALFIGPSQRLVEQIAGDTEDKTFELFSGGLRVTKFYQHDRDTTGDLVGATDEIVLRAIAEGYINLRDYAIVDVDEAHHLLSARMQKLMEHPQIPSTMLGFTATPAYVEKDKERDLRERYETIFEGKLLDYILNGLLNGAQLYTFRVDLSGLLEDVIGLNEDELMEKLSETSLNHHVAEAAKALVAQGRKVAIYCQRGGKSKQARDIATLLQNDGIRAEAIGTRFNTKQENDEYIARHATDIDVLTTVGMITEAYNGRIDAVITVGRRHSKLALEQIIGRGTRPSKDFPVTVYMEFLPILHDKQETMVSLWDLFDKNQVIQGYIFAKQAPESTQSDHSPGENGAPEPTERPKQKARPRESYAFDSDKVIRPNDLPVDLQELAELSDRKLVRAITLANPKAIDFEPIPENYVRLSNLVKATRVTGVRLRGRLEAAGYSFIARWENTDEGFRLEYFFPPEAEEYALANAAPPEPKKGEEVAETALLGRYNMREAALRSLAKKLGYEPFIRKTIGKIAKFHYPIAVQDAIDEEIEKMPWKEEDDTTIKDAIAAIGCPRTFAYRYCQEQGISSVAKRYYGRGAKVNYGNFISSDEAEGIRLAYESIPVAEEGEKSKVEMAAAAGVSPMHIGQIMTPEEKSLGTPKRSPEAHTSGRTPERFPATVVHQVIDRAKRDVKPDFLVTAAEIQEVISAGRGTILRELYEAGFREVALSISKKPDYCFSWPMVKHLERRFGLRPGVEPIDYDSKIQGLELPANKILQLAGSELLDAEAIASHARVPIPVVKEQIEVVRTQIRGLPNTYKKANRRSIIAEHYTGRFLQAISVGLGGTTTGELATLVHVAEPAIDNFLTGHPKTVDGRVGLASWDFTQRAFRRAPADYVPLDVAAKDLQQPPEATRAFITEHMEPGHVRRFDNEEGQRHFYVSPTAQTLIAAQRDRKQYHPAPEGYFTRGEIVLRTNISAEAFDTWLKTNPPAHDDFGWYISQSDWVLPHFAPWFVTRYIVHLSKIRSKEH